MRSLQTRVNGLARASAAKHALTNSCEIFQIFLWFKCSIPLAQSSAINMFELSGIEQQHCNILNALISFCSLFSLISYLKSCKISRVVSWSYSITVVVS